MTTVRTGRRKAAVLTTLFAMLALLFVSFGSLGTTRAYADPPAKHLNFAQRHPTMTGIAAGAATHHMLKKSAARKKAMGKHLNFAERHPTLTGIGAAVGVHHVLKKSAAH